MPTVCLYTADNLSIKFLSHLSKGCDKKKVQLYQIHSNYYNHHSHHSNVLETLIGKYNAGKVIFDVCEFGKKFRISKIL